VAAGVAVDSGYARPAWMLRACDPERSHHRRAAGGLVGARGRQGKCIQNHWASAHELQFMQRVPRPGMGECGHGTAPVRIPAFTR